MAQRNKNIILIIGFFVILFMAYKFAFSKTIDLKNQIETLKSQSINQDNINSLSASLAGRERYMDSVLKKHNVKGSSVQNNLLEFLNAEALKNEFKITEFNKPHQIATEQGNIMSYIFTIQGDYTSLQNIIYKLEQVHNFGEVVHYSFEKKRDYRRRKDYLECSVIVENYLSK